MKPTTLIFCSVLWITPLSAFGDTRIAECRAIGNDSQRLACYDAIPVSSPDSAAEAPAHSVASVEPTTSTPAVSKAPPPNAPVASVESATPEAVVEEAAASATADAATVISLDDPIDLFGRSDREIRDVAVRESAGKELERIEATAVTVRELSSVRIVFELDNGQTWEQTESGRFRLREGERVEIRRGRLGAYFLKRVGTNRSIRVRRRL